MGNRESRQLHVDENGPVSLFNCLLDHSLPVPGVNNAITGIVFFQPLQIEVGTMPIHFCSLPQTFVQQYCAVILDS
jgi:hypothetical protein